MAVRYGPKDRFYRTKVYSQSLFKEIVESAADQLWRHARALQELADLMDAVGLVVDDLEPCSSLSGRITIEGGVDLDGNHGHGIECQFASKALGLNGHGEPSYRERGFHDGRGHRDNYLEMSESSTEYRPLYLKNQLDNLEGYIEKYARDCYLHDADPNMIQLIDMGVLRNLEKIRVYLGVGNADDE